MTIAWFALAAVTVAGTVAAMSLRNPVHCVIALTVGLIGLAAIYLLLGAQFVGFTQILVYVGAVAILAVFAIMMTRSVEPVEWNSLSPFRLVGVLIAGSTFAVLAWAIWLSAPTAQAALAEPESSANRIGSALMHRFVLPLEIIGVLLTAALIGAAVLAMDEAREAR